MTSQRILLVRSYHGWRRGSIKKQNIKVQFTDYNRHVLVKLLFFFKLNYQIYKPLGAHTLAPTEATPPGSANTHCPLLSPPHGFMTLNLTENQHIKTRSAYHKHQIYKLQELLLPVTRAHTGNRSFPSRLCEHTLPVIIVTKHFAKIS